MFLGMPLVHFLVDNKDYLTELFSIHNMLSGIFEAILFGAIMQGLVNAGIKQAKSQAEKGDQYTKNSKKNPGFPSWIFRSKEDFLDLYTRSLNVSRKSYLNTYTITNFKKHHIPIWHFLKYCNMSVQNDKSPSLS